MQDLEVTNFVNKSTCFLPLSLSLLLTAAAKVALSASVCVMSELPKGVASLPQQAKFR